MFKTNYSKPFQEAHLDLAYRVDLKHWNAILLKFESLNKFWKVYTKSLSILETNTISLFVDVALRAASIL